jgi:predicted phage baseplate assembly protein
MSACECGCCEGITALTPASVENRPGLDSLAYRVGTHATFLASMEAALSDATLLGDRGNPLADLATREPSDLSIALLDAWACIADVLGFYQERIANEGYLRTATERRSVLELAKLVGYRLRPGVAASAYLAFTLDDGYALAVPAGTRAQTVPGPGEQPQSFETKEDLEARAAWNVLTPRQTAPQQVGPGRAVYLAGEPDVRVGMPVLLVDTRNVSGSVFARIQSVEAQPDANRTKITLLPAVPAVPRAAPAARTLVDEVLGHPLAQETATGRRIAAALVEVQEAEAPDAMLEKLRSALPVVEAAHASSGRFPRLQPWLATVAEELSQSAQALEAEAGAPAILGPAAAAQQDELDDLVEPLVAPPSVPPRSRFALGQSVASLGNGSDARARILHAFYPSLDLEQLYEVAGSAPAPAGGVELHVLRVTSALFGQAAPKTATYDHNKLNPPKDWMEWDPADDEAKDLLYLDAEQSEILAPSYAVVEAPNKDEPQVFRVEEVITRARAEYGLTGKSTRLKIDGEWWDPHPVIPVPVINLGEAAAAPQPGPFDCIRQTVVHARSELLPLAEAPIELPVAGSVIDLDSAQPGLGAGRWLVVTGRRLLRSRKHLGTASSIFGGTTVPAAELVMLGGVQLRAGQPGAQFAGKTVQGPLRTWLELATPLAYVYERDTVKIYGNVVDSTQGETHHDVLGSGDATQALQRFVLKSPPLTYVAAATPSGAESTLEVRVDEVRWHEAAGVADLGPGDRKYLTETDDEHKTSVVFGDGKRGARLPTGAENVVATYRSGIGKAGNAKAGQISQLATKPLGLKEVVNPLRATGGADPDSRDAARRNAPLAVTALDRLVSVQDYEDFARLYAGIGKASAARLTDGRRQLVHVTIAGVDDIPIDPSSDLFAGLSAALRLYGDPVVPLSVAVRELLVLVVAAKVRVLPDYSWPLVEPHVRAALLDAFGFERRELGQDVLSSEVLSLIEAVPGVAFVDLDALDALEPPLGTIAPARNDRIRVRLARATAGGPILPAQLAILEPDVPDTLLLSELPQ